MQVPQPLKQLSYVVLAAILFTGCTGKPTLFRAFADGTMAWWSLSLYEDKTFDMHLGASDCAGTYAAEGDTIWLAYSHAPVPGDAPKGILVDRALGIVVGLQVDSLSGALVEDRGMWMQIQEDRLSDK